MSNSFYVPAGAMVIMAHPDDIEFGCAGTVARWIQGGCRVSYVLCTSGDVGIAEDGLTRAQAAEIREGEQQAAADLLGVQEVVFLREPDGMLENTLDLRRRLVREIRRFRPEVVIATDPTAFLISDDYINHPDHRAAAAAALDAVFPAAGQPHLFEELADEGLSAHKVRKVYIAWTDKADTFVNISETMELKIQALQKHASQFRNWDPAPMVREWSAAAGKGKEMAYAEGFKVVTLVSDEEWEKRQNGAAA